MNEITQIRKLSLWIFFIPLLAINICLLISQNPEFLNNTFFAVDQIGRSGYSIPYLDGSLSISRASRTFPQYLIFKPSMITTAILLYYYWKNNNNLVNKLYSTKINYRFKTFGILSAVFLAIHSIFLGIKFDNDLYKLFRRVVMLSFIVFEIAAQAYLVVTFVSFKEKLKDYINPTILNLKIFLVSFLILVALISIPIISLPGDDFFGFQLKFFKHALEWDYFIGVITFYLLTFLMWKKSS